MPAADIERAHAKLTRTLRVVGTRPDGMHLLEAEMVSLDLADELAISAGDGLEVHDEIAWRGSTRPPLELALDETNLVRRALSLMGCSAHVLLTKRIPLGAGLGGGSSDAAAVLRWGKYTDIDLAVSLGADVPFCLRGGRALVRGVGEVLEPLAFEERFFVLVTPALPVATAAVYRAFDDLGHQEARAENDLEAAALVVEPRLTAWREVIERATDLRANLAGSGSTWFVECAENDGNTLLERLSGAIAKNGDIAALVFAKSVPQES